MTLALEILPFQETPQGQAHVLARCWLKVLEGPGQGWGAWGLCSRGMGGCSGRPRGLTGEERWRCLQSTP